MRSTHLTLATVLMCSSFAACDGTDATQDINLDPATLDEADNSLALLNERQAADPKNPAWPAAYARLRSRLDQLNHLVARTEAEPGRIVSFYAMDDGSVFVSESGPKDGKRLLAKQDVQGGSVVDLYRRLARTEPPRALVEAYERTVLADPVDLGSLGALPQASPRSDAPVAAADGTTTATSALTTADAAYYLANGCYGGGEFGADFRDCRANQTGTVASVSGKTKTSFFNVAILQNSPARVRLKISSETKLIDPINPGQWLWWWGFSSKYTVYFPSIHKEYNLRTHQWEILDIAGDIFDWAWGYKSDCEGIYNCDLTP